MDFSLVTLNRSTEDGVHMISARFMSILCCTWALLMLCQAELWRLLQHCSLNMYPACLSFVLFNLCFYVNIQYRDVTCPLSGERFKYNMNFSSADIKYMYELVGLT